MKKLAIVLLFVMVGCRRQAVVSSAPATQPAAANATGGATPREALEKFMASAKAQDLQAMSNVWGTKSGPARNDRRFMTIEDMEKRMIVMMRCLRHDSYAIRGETPATGGDRVFRTEVRRGNLTPATDFTVTQGPQSRWYVLMFELKDLNSICQAR